MSEQHAPAVVQRLAEPVPAGTFRNLVRYVRYDCISGLLVALIALPLCLAISLASGYPAIAGVFTAVIGGVVAGLISRSELTIKGPAAGLIVIALGCMQEFGYTGGQDAAADMQAYRMALAVGAAAAGLQILFALLRAGVLGEFFPTAAVHGMLAAIGVIIISKQIPVAVGLKAHGEPLELLAGIPSTILHMNPEIAVIGAISLGLLFGKPLIRHPLWRKIPAPLVVIVVAIPLGAWFDLSHDHTYTLAGHRYRVGEQHLVNVPYNVLTAVVHPDFSALRLPAAWKWVAMYALIGSLESLLSAKAIDLLDPWKRKTNLDRDLLAVGIGNLLSAMVGGLPMISEIVRSRANIDNGARTRFANMYHGLCLVVFVVLLPGLIHRIPLAALAAMLIYTGYRLAHPREFVHAFKIGPEQFLVYVTTLVTVLATDLLIGVAVGVVLELAIDVANGAKLRSLFRPVVAVEAREDGTCRVAAADSAVFSNWVLVRKRIVCEGLQQRRDVVLDLSGARFVDHTVMEKIHELELQFQREGLRLQVVGLELHRSFGRDPRSARKLPKNSAAGGSRPGARGDGSAVASRASHSPEAGAEQEARPI
ncbi:MAG: SulP family inorganic anion transporter [Pirellulales bacterium]|nr:SulP family inorganic anion transporter [Pirellulales bacterium]